MPFSAIFKGEDIFNDRRRNPQGDHNRPPNCRRRRDICSGDATPWWLKVNYVSHQLDLIDGGNRDTP